MKHVDADDEEGDEGQGGQVSILQSHSCGDESSDTCLVVMVVMMVIVVMLKIMIMVKH